MANPYGIPPWIYQGSEEVDEFGNPIAKPGLPFDPGPTPIPQTPPDPRASGINAMPVGQATGQIPPWAEQPPPPEPQPANFSENPTPQWAQAETQGHPAAQLKEPMNAVDAISGGGSESGGGLISPPVNPMTWARRTPTLAEQENRNISEMGGLEAGKAEQRAKMMQGATAEQERLINEGEARRQQREVKLAAFNEQRMKDADEYAQGKINPERWAERNGAVSKLAFGIAAFFSGLANPRGPNQVVEWINREIEQDLATQRANLEQKGRALMAKNSLYSDLMAQYHDSDLADAAFRQNRLALAQNQIAAMEAGYAPEEQKLLARQTLIETEKQRRAAEADFAIKAMEAERKVNKDAIEADQKTTDQLLRKYDIDKGAAVTMRGQDISAETQRRGQDLDLEKEKAKKEQKLNEDDRERAIYGPDPAGGAKNVVIGSMGTGEDGKKARAATAAHREFMVYAKKYQQLREKHGRVGLNKSEAAEMRQAYSSMLALWNGKMHLGAFDSGTERLAKGALPEPQSDWSIGDYIFNTDSAVGNVIDLGNVAIDEYMDSMGFQSSDGTSRYSDYLSRGSSRKSKGETAAGEAQHNQGRKLEPGGMDKSRQFDESGKPLPAPSISAQPSGDWEVGGEKEYMRRRKANLDAKKRGESLPYPKVGLQGRYKPEK